MSQGFTRAQAGIFVEVGQIADQGSPAPLISGWPVEITDGTNILGTSGHPLYTTGQEIVVGNVSVSGIVSVHGTVNISGTSLVTVTNFPANQQVFGSVTISGTPAVSVSNFPANAQVMAGPLPGAIFPVTGSVTLSGTPAVSVSNFPTVQTIQGTVNVSGVVVEIGTVNVSGLDSVGIKNFPANQQVFGSVTLSGNPQVSVSNFPAVQTVQGTVNVSGVIVEVGTVNLSGLPPGQALMANSLPVTIASNQSTISISVDDFSVVLRNAFAAAFVRNGLIKNPGTGQLAVNQFPALPVYIDQVANAITLAAVTAVTTLNQLGSIPIRDAQITPAERTLWQLAVRNRIS